MMLILTYKECNFARIPARQVCIETGCKSKHHILLYHLESKWKEMHEFSLTAIPCKIKGNSLDTMIDIRVVHDAYWYLQSLYRCSYPS